MEALTPKTANSEWVHLMNFCAIPIWIRRFEVSHVDSGFEGGFPATSTLQPKPCHSEVVSRISLSPFATGGKLA